MTRFKRKVKKNYQTYRANWTGNWPYRTNNVELHSASISNLFAKHAQVGFMRKERSGGVGQRIDVFLLPSKDLCQCLRGLRTPCGEFASLLLLVDILPSKSVGACVVDSKTKVDKT